MTTKKALKKEQKVRQNFTLSPSTLEHLREMARRNDTCMSSLLNAWIREKWQDLEERNRIP